MSQPIRYTAAASPANVAFVSALAVVTNTLNAPAGSINDAGTAVTSCNGALNTGAAISFIEPIMVNDLRVVFSVSVTAFIVVSA